MYVSITLVLARRRKRNLAFAYLLASFFLLPKRLPKTDPRSHAHRSSTGTPAKAVSMCIPHPTPAYERTNRSPVSLGQVPIASRHSPVLSQSHRRRVVVVASRTGPGWLITLAALHSSAHLVRRRSSSSLTSSASFSEAFQGVGTENRAEVPTLSLS
jgi:hypothetical protein